MESINTKNNDVLPTSSQFSGIFKKALISQEKNKSTTNPEFLTPSIKELNLKDYFGKFMETDNSKIELIKRVSRNFNDGQITLKT